MPTTRPKVEAPPLPEEAQPELLDFEVRKELRSLPTGLAEVVARHLVAAAMVLDEDPSLALAHARAAASLAARLPATREAAGIAAYHAGEYATALIELRAARRMDGSARYLPMIADSERGLGRPERAVAFLTDPAVDGMDPAGKAELLIVGSGARRDLGQPEAAVVLLAEEANRLGEPRPWTARLRYAYAEALLDAGRAAEALRAFESSAAVDEEGQTDAAERADELRTQLPADPEPATPAPVPPTSTTPESVTPASAPLAPTTPEPATPAVTSAAPADEAQPATPTGLERGLPAVGKGALPVVFDDGGALLAQAAAEAAERAKASAAQPAMPDLSVLFSDLGLREVPAGQRRPVAPPEVEAADDDVVNILDEDDSDDEDADSDDD